MVAGILVNIGSGNGLSPGRRQAIVWTNAGILSITPQRTYFNEISFDIQIFSFKKMHLNISSAKWRPFCPGRDALKFYSNDSNADVKIINAMNSIFFIIPIYHDIT